jgi:hypothetical protein
VRYSELIIIYCTMNCVDVRYEAKFDEEGNYVLDKNGHHDVNVFTRQFATDKDEPVIVIDQDSTSNWWNSNKGFHKHDHGPPGLDSSIDRSVDATSQVDGTVRMEDPAGKKKKFRAMGLVVSKIENSESCGPSFIQIPLDPTKIEYAEYLDCDKAQAFYRTHQNIKNSNQLLEYKNQWDEFAKTLPTRPSPFSKGFPAGSAKRHMDRVEPGIQVMERLVRNNKNIKKKERCKAVVSNEMSNEEISDNLPVIPGVNMGADVKKMYMALRTESLKSIVAVEIGILKEAAAKAAAEKVAAKSDDNAENTAAKTAAKAAKLEMAAKLKAAKLETAAKLKVAKLEKAEKLKAATLIEKEKAKKLKAAAMAKNKNK